MTDRELLRHTLESLAHRAAKAVHGAPESFAAFRAGPDLLPTQCDIVTLPE